MAGLTVKLDQAAIEEFLRQPNGEVAAKMQAAGDVVANGAKSRAPVSADGEHGRPAGYLRSTITSDLEADSDGVFARVSSHALTPQGVDYGLIQEIGRRHAPAQPYLRPALDDLRGKRL